MRARSFAAKPAACDPLIRSGAGECHGACGRAARLVGQSHAERRVDRVDEHESLTVLRDDACERNVGALHNGQAAGASAAIMPRRYETGERGAFREASH